MDSKIKCNIKLKRPKKDSLKEKAHKINEDVLNIFKKKEEEDEDEENEIKDEGRIEHIKCIKEGKVLIDIEKQKENSKDHLYLNFLNNLENKLNRIQNKKEIIYLNFPNKSNNNNNNNDDDDIKSNISNQYDDQDMNSSIHSNNKESSEKDSDIEIKDLSSFIIHKNKNNLKLNNNEKKHEELENNKIKTKHKNYQNNDDSFNQNNDDSSNQNNDDNSHQNNDDNSNQNNDDPSNQNLTHIYKVTEKNLTFKRKILIDKFDKNNKDVLLKNEINLYDDFKEHNIKIDNYGTYILKKMGYKEDVYNEYINKYYNESSEQNYFDKIYNNLQSRDFRFTGVGAEEEMKQNMENIKKGNINHELKGDDTHNKDDNDNKNDQYKKFKKHDIYDKNKKYDRYDKKKKYDRYDKKKKYDRYDKNKKYDRYDKYYESYSSTSKNDSCNSDDSSQERLHNEDNTSSISNNAYNKINKYTKHPNDKYKLSIKSNSTNSSNNKYDYKKKTNKKIEEHKYSTNISKYNNDKNYVFFEGLIVKINLETHEFYKWKGIVLYKIKKEKEENEKQKTKNTYTYIYGLLIFKHYKNILPYKNIIKHKLKDMKHNLYTQEEHKNIWTHFINELNIKMKSNNHNNYSDHDNNQYFNISQIKSNYLETTISQDILKCKIVNKNLKHPIKEDNLYKETVELKKIKLNHAYIQIRKKYILKVSLDDICQYV
ncbi:conserved Plasmodium protein, unknown function [Plasmodium sp. gorilla clade G2]|uniref:conserved Plasmodium protein, unknown function n=1 Tax=Plasmodium sp. gorilla clade G2 TaxID=880535 RepID=UPI000D21D11A|nr:conserved Plasmodium protein, unknown function [Plasmodium sp. gorilla clade G2]SOV14368.1 conserved Plasmodium protein, unknown function [Plasmodium sp. gorilla clade G2]